MMCQPQSHHYTNRVTGAKLVAVPTVVMAGLVPAIPINGHCSILIEIAGTSPAMTPRVLPLLHKPASK
jgi:hypothetical protein